MPAASAYQINFPATNFRVAIADDGLPALSFGTLDVVDSYNPVMRFGSRASSPSQVGTPAGVCKNRPPNLSVLSAFSVNVSRA